MADNVIIPQLDSKAVLDEGDMFPLDDGQYTKKVTASDLSRSMEVMSTEGLTKECSGKDGEGIFTTVEWKTEDGTLVKKSVLSGTSPLYDTRTVSWYYPDGVAVRFTVTYSLSYDLDGDFVGEELVV